MIIEGKERLHDDNERGTNDDGGNKCVDSQLADIVLVKKNEMNEWQRKLKELNHDLNLTKRKVNEKLVECQLKYNR